MKSMFLRILIYTIIADWPYDHIELVSLDSSIAVVYALQQQRLEYLGDIETIWTGGSNNIDRPLDSCRWEHFGAWKIFEQLSLPRIPTEFPTNH